MEEEFVRFERVRKPRTEAEFRKLVERTAKDPLLLPALEKMDVLTLSKLALMVGKTAPLNERHTIFGRFLIGHMIRETGREKHIPIAASLVGTNLDWLSAAFIANREKEPAIFKSDKELSWLLGPRGPELLRSLRERVFQKPVLHQLVGAGTAPVFKVRKKYEHFFQQSQWRNPTEHIESQPNINRGDIRLPETIRELIHTPYDSTRVKEFPMGIHPITGKLVVAVSKRFPQFGERKGGAEEEVNRTVRTLLKRVRTPKAIGVIQHGPNKYALFEKVEAPAFMGLQRDALRGQLLRAGAKEGMLTDSFLDRKVAEAFLEFKKRAKEAEEKGVRFYDLSERNILVHFNKQLKPVITFVDFERVRLRKRL